MYLRVMLKCKIKQKRSLNQGQEPKINSSFNGYFLDSFLVVTYGCSEPGRKQK